MKQKNKRHKLPSRHTFHLIRGKTVFTKYLITCVAVILLSFIFLGTAVTVMSVSFSNSDRKRSNAKWAHTISNLMTGYITYSASDDTAASKVAALILNQVGNYEQILNDQTGAVVCIVRSDGSLVNISNPRAPDVQSNTIPNSIMKIMKSLRDNQEYSEIGTLDGFFSAKFSTVGVPIEVNDQKVGAVFVSSPANNLMKYMYDIIRIFLICITLSVLFSVVVLYFLTSKMVRPLRQMSLAAKSFSKGDFSARIPVDDNDEIGQLAAAFNNMAASLTTLEEMRRTFVANVSHELKTPMTSISGFIDGILDGTIPPDRQEHYLSIVSQEVKRLSRLVRSFLEISRIEAGELKISPSRFDVAETIKRVVVGFEYAINDKQLDVRGLDIEKEYFVTADPDITHQVIYNLVDNAIKFSDNGGYLEVHVAGRGDKVYVGVKNSGMGIPANDLPYVFDRFYKTDKSRSSDRKGVGLGLYIVKTVLNLQGQDISVKSVEGEYCEFVFTLAKA